MFKYVKNAKQLINVCNFQTNQIRLTCKNILIQNFVNLT